MKLLQVYSSMSTEFSVGAKLGTGTDG